MADDPSLQKSVKAKESSAPLLLNDTEYNIPECKVQAASAASRFF